METGLFFNFTINEKLPSHRTEIVVVVKKSSNSNIFSRLDF